MTALATLKAALKALFEGSPATREAAANGIADAVDAYHLAVPDPAAIPKSALTAAGEMVYGSAASTPATLAAGTSGYYLKGNGAAAPIWENHVGASDPHTQYALEAQEAWHVVGASGQPAFQNSWASYYSSGNTIAFMKDTLGFVHLRGMVKSGTITATAFILPAGYRPAESYNFPAASNSAFGYGYILAAGNVVPQVGNNAWFTLDGVTFKAEA